jgi:hypothetical protein
MTQRTSPDLETAFDSFHRSAFRLELRDRYNIPSEAEPFQRFLAGQPHDPAWRESWTAFVRAALRDGKRISRVHVVREPLSDYLEFELTRGYPASVAAGEDVRILDLTVRAPLLLPDHDFWLFDDREAGVMDYSPEGEFLGAAMTSDPDAIKAYRQVRDLAVERAVPLAQYLGSLGLKEAV